MTDNGGSPDAVVIERNFDAPVDLIWQMWTDPTHFCALANPGGRPRRINAAEPDPECRGLDTCVNGSGSRQGRV
jgi:uncharacterized protein YndB with AHSA1/START domain